MAANPSAGGCGVEDQVGRASATLLTRAGAQSSWWALLHQTGRNRREGGS
jgi:hypothetical protein